MAETSHEPAHKTELATEIELSGHHDTKFLAMIRAIMGAMIVSYN